MIKKDRPGKWWRFAAQMIGGNNSVYWFAPDLNGKFFIFQNVTIQISQTYGTFLVKICRFGGYRFPFKLPKWNHRSAGDKTDMLPLFINFIPLTCDATARYGNWVNHARKIFNFGKIPEHDFFEGFMLFA